MAKYTYLVNVTRTIISTGSFEVSSPEKLTEDEVTNKAIELANQGEEPEDGWEECDTEYSDPEIEDGEDNLKEE